MTVHVHHTVGSVAIGDHQHDRPTPKKGAEPERTWSFDCEPECEAQVVKSVELAASHETAVPLTHDEQLEAEKLSTAGTKAAGELFKALVEGAKEQVAAKAG